ncbi:MAG: Fic family protein [Myxococcales bacterium]
MPRHDRPPQGVDTLARIEPLRLERIPEPVADAVAELTAAATRLGQALHSRTAAHLAGLVRIMNTYYSNLIEGHDTRPRDIERALRQDLERDAHKRDLQLEAAAHVRIQQEVDRRWADADLPEPASGAFLRWLHREFYRGASTSRLTLEGPDRTVRFVPGQWRGRPEHDVAVGKHIPPSSARVDEFMRLFERSYRLAELGPAARILCLATAHHRFNYIHPFVDGNGRVSRLMSHAMGLWSGIGAHGLWSISRGLARGLRDRREYLQMMELADSPRRDDLDGRGNLSEEALEAYVSWFLRVCIDQVTFMEELFELGTLERRLRDLAGRRKGLGPAGAALLVETLHRGELERGEAPRATGLPERSARRVLNQAVRQGLLASDTPKGPVSLRFPIEALDALFPRLYA